MCLKLSTLSKILLLAQLTIVTCTARASADEGLQRLLYVAEPGIRNYLEYGGHGVVVLDIDHDYAFVKRIPFQGFAADGTPDNVKGICGNAGTGKLYISTRAHLICIDLFTDQVLWERQYAKGCDRMSMSPDGSVIYQPSFEKENWYVIDATSGDVLHELHPDSKAHNTVFSVDGSKVFLAGLGSPLLSIADSSTHQITSTCGPFSSAIRPFTVNGSASLCFVNVNELLGFEIGDLKTGKKLHRVEVVGFTAGPVKRHGCPSHGIAMTPDEKEIWLTDGHNERLHVFNVSSLPPKQVATIKVREQPGWITFSLDGRTCWSSTGDVIDTASRQITHQLTDEEGRMLMSEKMLEVQLRDTRLVAVGDQFGRGSVPGK